MDAGDQSPEEVYSVWALPPEPVRARLRGVMAGLRAAHGGPAFEPHATVVGAIRLRRSAAVEALRAAAAGVRPYTARVVGVARGDFFYQCVYLLLEPTPEVPLLPTRQPSPSPPKLFPSFRSATRELNGFRGVIDHVGAIV